MIRRQTRKQIQGIRKPWFGFVYQLSLVCYLFNFLRFQYTICWNLFLCSSSSIWIEQPPSKRQVFAGSSPAWSTKQILLRCSSVARATGFESVTANDTPLVRVQPPQLTGRASQYNQTTWVYMSIGQTSGLLIRGSGFKSRQAH